MKRIKATLMVKEFDRGWDRIKKLRAELRDGRTFVKVGVIGDRKGASQPVETADGKNAKIDVVGLAMVHEFGTRTIPARPWISGGFNANKAKYFQMQKLLTKGIFEGTMQVERALGILGAALSADIKNYVTKGTPIGPPNAASTLRRKMQLGRKALQQRTRKALKADGVDLRTRKGRGTAQGPIMVRTLVDTGRMVNSVAWVVVVQGNERRAG